MQKKAFTLIETMMGILIFSMVFVAGFQALTAIGVGKIKLIQDTNIEKQSLYFSEKFFEMIKKGGTLDYEEYFNRKVRGNTSYGSGHYDILTGFGNYNDLSGVNLNNDTSLNFYRCLSGVGIANKLTGDGCFTTKNDQATTFAGKPQRYGQYAMQFVDYNSNYDSDIGPINNIMGDEDDDGNVVGDDDDEFIGIGPETFTIGDDLKELYLISGDGEHRTLFRWNVKPDPFAGTRTCTSSDGGKSFTGSTAEGCLGTIEFLKLEGKDWGIDHDSSTSGTGAYDGVIDTWLLDKNTYGLTTDILADSIAEDYWVSLFPENINVTSFKIFAYPNGDVHLNWKSEDDNLNISPYVRIQYSILPSWETRRQLKMIPNELQFSTTISLTDVFSN